MSYRHYKTLRKEGPLTGKTFLFTGTLPTYSRTEAGKMVEERGGKVVETISKSVDYLVVGESAGSKLAKAEKLGIPLLDEAAFRQVVNG